MSITAAAEHLQISVPRRNREYQTCPRCSYLREKTRDRCLQVSVAAGAIRVLCFHCHWEDRA